MKREILLYANSDSSSDMLYFAQSFIPDDFFAFTQNGERCAILSPLEIGRARKESAFSRIYEYADEREIFNELGLKKFLVPRNFPAFMLEKLRRAKFDIVVADGEIFPERVFKDERQTAEIRKANMVSAKCYALIRKILANSSVDKKGALIWNGQPLTSEILRRETDLECMRNNALAKSTIIAAGNQACDPHCIGYGKIYANTPIVADIFPRLNSSGYFGDMTRTFVKGKPTDDQKKIYQTVKDAHDAVLDTLHNGVAANKAHFKVVEIFEKAGFKTYCKNGAWYGFFHSTGHGVGLDIHEAPRLSTGANILKTAMVVTDEPGLYYKNVGACRIEDCVRITENGCELLSNFDYIQQVD